MKLLLHDVVFNASLFYLVHASFGEVRIPLTGGSYSVAIKDSFLTAKKKNTVSLNCPIEALAFLFLPILLLSHGKIRMRSSLVVRASDCQCTSCNGPGFDPSIRRHSGI
jgi:hypothetical protein